MPIAESELDLLEALENAPTQGWSEITGKQASTLKAAGAPAQLLHRNHPIVAGGDGTHEVRGYLSLPVSATKVFEHLYDCAFLGSCLPSWGFDVCASSARLENEIVRIVAKQKQKEVPEWRRLRKEAHGDNDTFTWLMRPASTQDLGHGAGKALPSLDFMGLASAVCGFRLHSDGAESCQLFLYVQIPSSNMLMRAGLRSLLPRIFRKFCKDLFLACTRGQPSVYLAEPFFEDFESWIAGIDDEEADASNPSVSAVLGGA